MIMKPVPSLACQGCIGDESICVLGNFEHGAKVSTR
jgi:hypothetical protein